MSETSRSELVQLLSSFIKNLPKEPGVYRFLNIKKEVLYIGKAKNLKNRVSSYFISHSQKTRKLKKLVSQIHSIEYTVVFTELDALLLESNLIKKYQPPYNILLKDGKSYPYICITQEAFPRIFASRQKENKNQYFGPYANISVMNMLLGLFKELYQIRSCSLTLTPANIQAKKFQVCLDYHIKKCKGPCAGLQQEEDYLKDIHQMKQILKGRLSQVKSYFKEMMQTCAHNLEFEKAHLYKKRLELLEKFQAKSMIIQSKNCDVEVYTIQSGEKEMFVNYMKVIDGCIIQAETFPVVNTLEETEEEILPTVILALREKYSDATDRIITNIALPVDLGVEVIQPKRGTFKQIVELSLKNISLYEAHRQKAREEFLHKKQTQFKILKQLKEDLNLAEIPNQIDCFDNSNIQGTSAVASAVCFVNGQPAKREYQRFHIKTVEGANDFLSMYEIVQRRYRKKLENQEVLPDLIVIDGGKGQLNFACKALKELSLYGKIPIIGIAKKLEEIYAPENTLPLHLNKKSPSLKLIQRIRNEAHRFAITFHRKKRSKTFTESSLKDIKGIGEKTISRLLTKYKSLEGIRKAPRKEIERMIGKSKTEELVQFLTPKNS